MRGTGPDLLASIARAVDAARAASLLEYATSKQVALTLLKLPRKVAIPILANLKPAAVGECLREFAPKRAARLLGPGTRWKRLIAAVGAANPRLRYEAGVTLGPAVRIDLLAQAPRDVIVRVLAEMSPTAAAELLALLPVDKTKQIFDAATTNWTPTWLGAMPPDAAIKILSALDYDLACFVLTVLPSSRVVRLLAMTRSEALLFETDRLRDALAGIAAAARQRQVRQLLEALGQALRRTWRLVTASRIEEADPMTMVAHATAVNLWQGLNQQARQYLQTDMSALARRRLTGSEDH